MDWLYVHIMRSAMYIIMFDSNTVFTVFTVILVLQAELC